MCHTRGPLDTACIIPIIVMVHVLISLVLVWGLAEGAAIGDEEGSELINLYHKENCYGELGCFSTSGDFADRWVNFLPQQREKINTKFYLHTRRNVNTWDAFQLKAHESEALQKSPFNPQQPTKIIVHGFLDDSFKSWVQSMRSELLIAGDFNVIRVDWGDGSSFPYTQATANTRLVGAEIALLINFICSETEAIPEDFHIIGHSLGGHTAGYAGQRVERLGRITGMDPAGPYFANKPASVRLDPNDALLVDVIHTDGASIINSIVASGGFGIADTLGTVDFFPNSGSHQPGCGKTPMRDVINEGLEEAALQFVACSHLRVLNLMEETINSHCPFMAYPCHDWSTFKEGRCLDCGPLGCGRTGFHADSLALPEGKEYYSLYQITGGEAPYCRYHYAITVSITDRYAEAQRGWLHVEVIGSRGSITKRITKNADSSKSLNIESGHSYTALTTAGYDLGEVIRARLWWTCDSSWWNVFSYCTLRTTVVYYDKVTILQGESQTKTTFCANNVSRGPKDSLNLHLKDCK